LSLLLGSAFAQTPTPIRSVTSLPGTCNGGTAGVSTDKVVLITAGAGVEYTCIAPNIWIPTPGGVNSQVANYPAVLADSGKIIAMNGASLTLTLPSPPPTTNWSITATNLNASTLTISRNGLLIDGAASNVSLSQNQGTYITTDGTNYFTSRGIGGASNWPGLGGGTNTSSTFTCGTGCTINTSGSGVNAATTMPFSGNTASSNTAAKTEGTGGSESPLNIGQVAGSQVWQDDGLVAPAISFGLTGGSFIAGRATSIRYTFVSAAGQTYGSVSTSGGNVSLGCSSGSTCQLTITAPTLPSGITGYSVYAQDCGTTPCGGSETLQAGCTNITGNCVLNSVGGGASIPTSNTAYLQPSPVATNECPAGSIPNWFIKDNSGNWHTQAAIDPVNTGSLPPSPYGTLTFCRRTWFNDSLSGGPPGKNSFIAIFHTPGVGVSSTGQDRALHLEMDNVAPDSNSYYGWEGIQSQVVVSGTPTFTGTPDGEESAGSFQTNMLNTNAMAGGTYGPNAIRAQIFRNANGSITSCTYCYAAVYAIATNGAAGSLSGGQMVAGRFIVTDSGGCTSCSGQAIAITKGTRFTSTTRGLGIEDFGTNTADWNIFSASTNGTPTSGRNWFGGNVYFANLITAAKEIAVTGSLVASGSVSSAAFATPSFANGNIQNIGTTGATTDTYKVTAVDGNGKESAVSGAGTTTTANATLDGTNFNRINLNAPTLVIGVGSYKVYRTTAGGTPSTTGLIGTITVTNTTLGGSSFTLDDTGLAGDGSTPPTVNNTGNIVAGGPTVSTASGPVSGSWKCVNVTPVTVSANVNTDQNLMACTIPAGTLNSVGKTLRIWAAGVYSTEVANASTIRLKAKLCTVSGCGSGTVITPLDLTSGANAGGQTNNGWNLTPMVSTQTAGASSAYESHGNLAVDLTGVAAADSVYTDANVATVGTIDSTVQLFLQITGTFSVAGAAAGNIFTERQLIVDSVN
jgi:hypothetical protein